MVNTHLLDQVKQQVAEGLGKEAIEKNLTADGKWKIEEINEALLLLGTISTEPNVHDVPIKPESPPLPVATEIPRASVEIPGVTSSSDSQSLPIPPEGLVPVIPIKYAGFWIRWVAIVVDISILIIPIGIIQFIVSFVDTGMGGSGSSIPGYLISTFISCLYFSIMTHFWGATLGKMLVGLKVYSEDQSRLSIGRVLLREIVGKFFSGIILGVGFIMAGFTKRKQALHDYLAHSIVVYKNPTKQNTIGLTVGIIISAILPTIIILGFLSSIVLVSLNTARSKASDASMIAKISSIRVNAEIYFTENDDSYSYATDCSSGMFIDPTIEQLIRDISSNDITCYAFGTSYALSAELSNPGSEHCIDSSGYNGGGGAENDGRQASCKASIGY